MSDPSPKSVDEALAVLYGDGHWPHELREFGGEWTRCEPTIEAVRIVTAELKRFREREPLVQNLVEHGLSLNDAGVIDDLLLHEAAIAVRNFKMT